jgi:hypothetical protein
MAENKLHLHTQKRYTYKNPLYGEALVGDVIGFNVND